MFNLFIFKEDVDILAHCFLYKDRQMQALLYILLIGVAIYQGRFGGIETQYFANIVADNFVFVLRWFSIPLIGISLLYTGANIKSPKEMYRLGKEVIKYTFSTTYIAALVALGYYLLISPKDSRLTKIVNYTPLRAEADMSTYGLLLFSTIFFAIGISLISLQQNEKMRGDYAKVINKMYDYLQIAIKVLLFFIPLAMYAFIVIFVAELQATNLSALMKYLSCVVLANLTQAFMVLPTFMLLNKVNPVKTLIGSFKALVVAFWSKSSSFALPVAIECATENLKVNEKVANFSLPLCISVNMNACAAA